MYTWLGLLTVFSHDDVDLVGGPTTLLTVVGHHIDGNVGVGRQGFELDKRVQGQDLKLKLLCKRKP